jgi:hypothetical protein
LNPCHYAILADILIPLASALIGGGLTLCGVKRTIKAEREESRKTYLESIKPFFVVESSASTPISENIRAIKFEDNTIKGYEDATSDDVCVWGTLTLTNVSNSACLLQYIRINGKKYSFYDCEPIKAHETVCIECYPMNLFGLKEITSIALGFYDLGFHTYEYNVHFEVQPSRRKYIESIEINRQKVLRFKYIDCNSEMLTGKKEDNDGHHGKAL